MPIFDTICKNCGFELEQLVINGENLQNCPNCNSEMEKACNCHSFKLNYDPKKDICGWSHDGYETTQRYRAQNGEKINGLIDE